MTTRTKRIGDEQPVRWFYFRVPPHGNVIEVIGRLDERNARVAAMMRLYGAHPEELEWTGAGLERIYE